MTSLKGDLDADSQTCSGDQENSGGGAWRFVSLQRSGKRYVWDPRPGAYTLKWWDDDARKLLWADSSDIGKASIVCGRRQVFKRVDPQLSMETFPQEKNRFLALIRAVR